MSIGSRELATGDPLQAKLSDSRNFTCSGQRPRHFRCANPQSGAEASASRDSLTPSEGAPPIRGRWEEHTSELQSRENLVCRLLLEKKTALIADLITHLSKELEVLS